MMQMTNTSDEGFDWDFLMGLEEDTIYILGKKCLK